jgi:hypothetical protein
MQQNRPALSLVAMGIVLTLLAVGISVEAKIGFMADPMTNVMPISWDQAFFNVINVPDELELKRGTILFDMKTLEDDTVISQSIGLIEASPEECLGVVRNYNCYTKIMPYTVESRIVRSFKVDGENAGAEAVDFWTKVCVFGFETGYLLRVVHLSDPENHLHQSYWTLVHNPAADSGCRDSNMRPCENDLDTNIGSHRFEPYEGNPNRTIHTYTLKLKGKKWVQRIGLRVGCGNSMREVTESIRNAVMKK